MLDVAPQCLLIIFLLLLGFASLSPRELLGWRRIRTCKCCRFLPFWFSSVTSCMDEHRSYCSLMKAWTCIDVCVCRQPIRHVFSLQSCCRVLPKSLRRWHIRTCRRGRIHTFDSSLCFKKVKMCAPDCYHCILSDRYPCACVRSLLPQTVAVLPDRYHLRPLPCSHTFCTKIQVNVNVK